MFSRSWLLKIKTRGIFISGCRAVRQQDRCYQKKKGEKILKRLTCLESDNTVVYLYVLADFREWIKTLEKSEI